jgi:hypothetical protein
MEELQPKPFQRAVEIAGDADKLRRELHVEEHSLQLWMRGRATAPAHVLHALTNLILEDDLDSGRTGSPSPAAPSTFARISARIVPRRGGR